ncbi:MAG: HDOD domain-containing protein [Planctomycetes bacterium]|nr:HDOD domain-containing protein [Planctomycetota bacterium]
MPKYTINQIIDRVRDLPTLPQIVVSLMSAIDDPRSSASHINQIMVNDPALAARVLKLVNSSFYSLPRKISSIRDAVVILGFSTVRSLAISASVLRTFGDKGFSHEDFWRQSLATGLFAEYLESQSNSFGSGNAFTVGLLCGIGKIILEQHFPIEFKAIIAEAQKQQTAFEEVERSQIDTSHAEIGYWLANRWRLPLPIQNAIRYQADPLACPSEADRPLAAAVKIARILVRVCGEASLTDFDPVIPPADDLWELIKLPNHDNFEAPLQKRLQTAAAIFAELV